MPHLAFRDQVADGAGDLFDRDRGVDPVLVEQVDRVDTQTPERCLGHLPDARRAAVERSTALAPGTEVEAELGRNHDLASERRQRVADQGLVGERPVYLGGVEEADAALHGTAQQGDHLAAVGHRAPMVVHAHAAQADGGDHRTVAAKPACLHPLPSCPHDSDMAEDGRHD